MNECVHRVRRLQPDDLNTLGTSPDIVLTDLTTNLAKYFPIDQLGQRNWLILLPEKINIHLNPEFLSTSLIETYLLAQHSDGPGTTQLIHNLRPQHVVFVHGSPTYLADLTSLEELQNRYHVHSPAAHILVELPIGETFLQPAVPENGYEGELAELGTTVTITLPEIITHDPRWREFADTGLVEARRQGEELVLRGLSQRELLNQSSDRHFWSELDCCGNCKYQRGQRCWNPSSPLYNFKITLEGFCPGFDRASSQPEVEDL